MSSDKKAVRQYALRLIATGAGVLGTKLAREFGVSRQVAHGYVQSLVNEGVVRASGKTRARIYELVTLNEAERVFDRSGLEEDVVWREVAKEALSDLPTNVRDIWHYAMTEMINNAIDHSGSEKVWVGFRRNALFVEAWVRDEGEGIFLKIQSALGLNDSREAILELAKGKVTTAPENHSGEGIFFTSRMVDQFDIQSGDLHFRHDQRTFDEIESTSSDVAGTLVVMRLENESPRTNQEVFDRFSDPEEYTFSKTHVPVKLAQVGGERLVSRSQAKRVAQRFEQFKHVELDFEGVEAVGQAFADELFRVFAAAHPGLRLVPINTSNQVAQMIRRAVAAREEQSAAKS